MSEPYVGQIIFTSFNYAPQGYALCDGSTLTITQNQALYSLISKNYGGDGVTTFKLPDLRGRVAVGMGVSPVSGASYPIAQYGGAEGVALTAAQLPAHSHGVNVSSNVGSIAAASNVPSTTGKRPNPGSPDPTTMYAGATSASQLVALDGRTVSDTGGGAAHNNMQPFQVASAAIALTGYYPQRP
ncbi:phage tail protein [Radicibacter daui]|uniref:phage tail protein n=1 Tax=Radicibacter daui TaxID=3064829 RepID=UPI0040470270